MFRIILWKEKFQKNYVVSIVVVFGGIGKVDAFIEIINVGGHKQILIYFLRPLIHYELSEVFLQKIAEQV